MDSNLSNKEQAALFKQWVKEYGPSILIALVLGLGINYGWRYYKQSQARTAITASNLYNELVAYQFEKKTKLFNATATKLKQDYSATPYATLAELFAAKQAVIEKAYPKAITALQWVISNSKVAGMQQIARIRMARIQLQQGKNAKALTTLKTTNDKSFSAVIDQVKGDAFLAQGNKDKAKYFYHQAIDAYASQGLSSPSIQFKLDQL